MNAVKLTPESLRKLANDIENNHKYHCKKNYAILSVKRDASGNVYAEIEQPPDYAECNSAYHRFPTEEVVE